MSKFNLYFNKQNCVNFLYKHVDYKYAQYKSRFGVPI